MDFTWINPIYRKRDVEKYNECQGSYKWFKILTQITKLQLFIYVYYDQ